MTIGETARETYRVSLTLCLSRLLALGTLDSSVVICEMMFIGKLAASIETRKMTMAIMHGIGIIRSA